MAVLDPELVARAMVPGPVAPGDWLAILPPGLMLVAGAVAVMLRGRPRPQMMVAVGSLALLVIVDALLLARVGTDGPFTMMMGGWLPPFGIAFTVDVAGAALALTAAVVGLAAASYVGFAQDAVAVRHGFFPFLLMLMAGVSGSFLTGDIFNLYVWFEVLLISSFGLLVVGGTAIQLDGAVKYGILNLIATTLFLIAVGLLYGTLGTLNMADIALKLSAAEVEGPIATIAALFLMAFAMKAAAFPLNAWLPAAYHTPRVVVSAVFGGLLTKVGIYALIRVLAMLMPAERAWLADVIAVIAGATMLIGAFGALAEGNMRRLVGYLVISGVGVLLAGLAIGSEAALSGMVAYAIHSMLATAALYLAVGLAEEAAGSPRLADAGGLWRATPVLAAVSLMLLFALSGLPPFSGFWPKAMLVEAALAGSAGWMATLILVTGFLNTMAAGRVFLFAFWRPAPEGAVRTAPDSGVLVPVVALVFVVTLLGIQPEPLIEVARAGGLGLANPAAYITAVFGGTP
ncbi:Na+/H+ antiporter subunit D [Segnochrobactraceae bacterium EtOH-i3]